MAELVTVEISHHKLQDELQQQHSMQINTGIYIYVITKKPCPN